MNDEDDDRVAFVGTVGHGFVVLTRDLQFGQETYPAGLVIGEEDCGVSKAWRIALGWSSNYCRTGGPSPDSEEEEEEEEEGRGGGQGGGPGAMNLGGRA